MKLVIEKGRVLQFEDGTNLTMKKAITFVFKDSYLFLPYPLRVLCRSFNINLAKGYFPFKLLDIFYNGVLPSLEYWTGIPLSDYQLLQRDFKNK